MKRSGRDEPMWVVIHIYMESMLGISLYTCLYTKIAKTLCLSYYVYVSSSTKSENKREEKVLPRSGGKEVPQTMCIHVSECKNAKIKKSKRECTIHFVIFR
jgi:hypothetical protein